MCHYTKSGHDGEHSDNGSEVSDEGYRSLGAVQPSAPISNGTNTTTTIIAGITNSQGSPTVVDCPSELFTSRHNPIISLHFIFYDLKLWYDG